MQIPEYCLKVGHEKFISYSFKFIIIITIIIIIITQVGSSPASYSGVSGFKSRPEDSLS
jgi:hypothetical protein